MKLLRPCPLLAATALALSGGAWAADPPKAAAPAPAVAKAADEVRTSGTVTVGGVPVAYEAVAGTLTVHPKDWDDSDEKLPGGEPGRETSSHSGDAPKKEDAEARMFYVAYLKKGAPGTRPVTFLYNGGPGSASIWLHMGAFGPRRVVTGDDRYTPAPPFHLVDNADSLLDVTDLVFIDAPGTGFGRITGRDKTHAFWGFDQDANAFANFITDWLSKYGRWTAPKYLFGESYGTTRSAMLANILEQDKGVGLNGVVLLSQILSYADVTDAPGSLAGNDLPFVLALPSEAATAWYHHRIPGSPADLGKLLAEVERFADHDYLLALQQGAALASADRDAIAAKLNRYTGLPVDYIKRADLRVRADEFEHELLADTDTTTGRLDSRFSGPSMDPLDKTSSYDPLDAAVGAAYTATFNDYVRHDLHYGDGQTYRTAIDVEHEWDFKHKQPDAKFAWGQTPSVLPDLAAAMKFDPQLHVQLNAGYFDLGTPFYEGIYEMRHLPMPTRLQSNIEYRQYPSGHMVYVHTDALKQLHDNVADFIRRTDGAHEPAAK